LGWGFGLVADSFGFKINAELLDKAIVSISRRAIFHGVKLCCPAHNVDCNK